MWAGFLSLRSMMFGTKLRPPALHEAVVERPSLLRLLRFPIAAIVVGGPGWIRRLLLGAVLPMFAGEAVKEFSGDRTIGLGLLLAVFAIVWPNDIAGWIDTLRARRRTRTTDGRRRARRASGPPSRALRPKTSFPAPGEAPIEVDGSRRPLRQPHRWRSMATLRRTLSTASSISAGVL